MSITHDDALNTFAARRARLLMVRRAVQWLTVWFFIWGAIVLAVRMAGFNQTYWLALGIFFALPAIILATYATTGNVPSLTGVH
jgi:hypothetical protein